MLKTNVIDKITFVSCENIALEKNKYEITNGANIIYTQVEQKFYSSN